MLDMLAMGGRIIIEKNETKHIISADFVTREGWFLDGFSLKEFNSLKSKRLILSRNGGDYRISRNGIEALQFARQS